MKIILARHSYAEDLTGSNSDENRILTESGRAVAAEQVQLLVRLAVIPDRIVASPYKRAQETAEIFKAALESVGSIETSVKLAPGYDLMESLDSLVEQSLHQDQTLLLVGHQPQIGNLALDLLGVPALKISVSPATLIILDVPNWRRGRASLLGMISGDRIKG